ncbi:YggT family protein [Patescibacteria group bacterium]|nr:YggT family protein [Patescibacteria group bacterium]
MDKIVFLNFTATFLVWFRDLVTIFIVMRVIISWFRMGQMSAPSRFTMFVFGATEPMMNLVRKLPHRIGMIDLSPLIILFGIDILVRFALTGLAYLA